MRRAVAVVIGSVLAAASPRALAEGTASKPEAAPKGGVFPVVEEVAKPEDAKALLDAAVKGAAGKDEARALETVGALLTKRHKSFVPELKKILADRRMKVAAAAAAALGSQGDKSVGPLLVRIVNMEVRGEKGEMKDGDLKAAAAESLGRLGVETAFEPVLRLAEKMRQEPDVQRSYAATVLRGCVRYFGLTKEKKSVGFLIEDVEQPAPSNPNSGTNPPESYWKARHDIWVGIRAEVAWALKEITGKEFGTLRRWRNWLDGDGKKEGMK
jgi:HEAT repeat protein